jgi:hypothetical protein
MAAVTDIKVRLAADLKRRFDKSCRESGTTMTAQLVGLIQASVDGDQPAKTSAELPVTSSANMDDASSTEAVLNPILADLRILAKLARQIAEDRPQNWFENWFATARAKERASDRAMLVELGDEQSRHLKSSTDSHRAVRNHIEEIARLALYREPRFYRNYKIWTAAGAGGLAMLFALALLPGDSALARFSAEKIVGGNDRLQSANIIAGDGDAFRGELIFETSALMKAEPFASNFGECVKRAKKSRSTFTCNIKFPRLVEAQ